MPTEMDPRFQETQDGEGNRHSAPYPLTPATIALWMRRGERLGHTLGLLALALPILIALVERRQQRQQKH